jgi:hypothetical protein
MVRWTITFTSRVDDESIGYQAVRKLLKAARYYGLRCTDVGRERLYRDDEERREALAEFVKGELERRVRDGRG